MAATPGMIWFEDQAAETLSTAVAGMMELLVMKGKETRSRQMALTLSTLAQVTVFFWRRRYLDLRNFDNYHGGSVVLNGRAGNDYIVAEGGECNAFQDGNSPIEVLRELHVDTLCGGEGNDTLIATNGGNLRGGEAECSR